MSKDKKKSRKDKDKHKDKRGKEPADDAADGEAPAAEAAPTTSSAGWDADLPPLEDRPKDLQAVKALVDGCIQRATHPRNPTQGNVQVGVCASEYDFSALAKSYGDKGNKRGKIPRDTLCLLYQPSFQFKQGEVPPTAAAHTCSTAKKRLFAGRRRRARHFTLAPQPQDLQLEVVWALNDNGHITADEDDHLVEVGVPLGAQDKEVVFARLVKVTLCHTCARPRARLPAVPHDACHPSGTVRHLTSPQVQISGGGRAKNMYIPCTYSEVRAAVRHMKAEVAPILAENAVCCGRHLLCLRVPQHPDVCAYAPPCPAPRMRVLLPQWRTRPAHRY